MNMPKITTPEAEERVRRQVHLLAALGTVDELKPLECSLNQLTAAADEALHAGRIPIDTIRMMKYWEVLFASPYPDDIAQRVLQTLYFYATKTGE